MMQLYPILGFSIFHNITPSFFIYILVSCRNYLCLAEMSGEGTEEKKLSKKELNKLERAKKKAEAKAQVCLHFPLFIYRPYSSKLGKIPKEVATMKMNPMFLKGSTETTGLFNPLRRRTLFLLMLRI